VALSDSLHDREALPLLDGARLLLRPVCADDAAALTDILTEPEVARWWGRNDIDSVREEMRAQPSFVIVVDGAVAGWLHVHEETDPDYPSVAFDIALTTAVHGEGYAQEALRVSIRHFIDRGHHRFTIDPAVDNERAVRCYAAVGFKPVGVLRAYERAPDGRWRDGLLMDLLADEFNS
jgi:aminoglycoside 6'-N-acetyltransferase